MCAIFVNLLCAVRLGLSCAYDAIIFACHMFMDFHAYVPSSFYISVYLVVGTFLIVSLSFSLSLPLMLVALWHLNINLLHLGTLFVLGHLLLLLLLTPFPLTSDSVMRRPNRTSLRTFHDAAFIRNAKSFCQIFLTLTYPLSLIVGVGSHFVASRSRALPWSYKSYTLICTNLITLHLFLSLAFKVCVW